MKKITTLILLALLPLIASASVNINGIYYNLNADTQEAEVTSGSSKYTEIVNIPETVTYNDVTYSVTSIGDLAFSECSGLTSVVIPNSVTTIGYSAFYACSGLTSVDIPNSVTSIGSYAFEDCSGLTSVVIPNSVTSIESNTFRNCSGLTSITIGNSVTSIDDRAFYGCSDLIKVTLNSNAIASKSNKSESSIRNIFGNQIEEYILGDDVTSIGDNAFRDCSSLTSVTISNNVTTIGNLAFYGCSCLTSIDIPNSVTSIGEYAFSGCSGLTEVTIGNSVTTIGNNAFSSCSGLTSIDIPSSVTSIGDSAFSSCSGLTSVHITDLESWCKINFYNNLSNPLSYAHHLYMNSSEITNLIIPNSVTSIGASSFYGCSGLTNIEIPNSVTSIGASAFYGCSGLTNIEIPNSVTSIGDYAFSVCSGLTSIEIPNSVTLIGNSAFSSCSSLTSINIPNSITSIGNYIFRNCTGLTSVTIPSSVTSIGSNAFKNCSGLTSIEIPNSVTSIRDYTFDGCSGLTSINIPNSITSIGNYVFRNCTGLISATIGENVTSIGYSAFQNCTGLTSVISEIKVPFAFGGSAFDGISSSCALTVPYGASDAYIAAGWTTDVFKGGIVEKSSENINMSANEIGTYCSPYDLDFSGISGLKAYIMSGFSPSTSTLVLTPVTMVPAGTGLLLKGAEGSYEVPYTTTDMYYTNLLKGVITATEIDPTDGEYTNFILSNGAHGIGFYTLSESGELAANKAYLQLPTASVASLSRAMRLVFADDITGIDEKKAETKKEDNIFYDLQGRRVDNPTQGLYIVNGKKVFINK